MIYPNGASHRLRALMQAVDLVRRIHRSADHLNGRSYLLLRRQPLPCRHCLAQGTTISLNTGPIVQRRRLCGIDIDFVSQFAVPLFLSRPGHREAARFSPRSALNFGRCDLVKGRTRGPLPLLTIGVDPGLDCLPGVRCVKNLALQRRVIYSLR
jgi:hypothetical protein